MAFEATLRTRLAAPFPIRDTSRDDLYLASYACFRSYFESRVTTGDLNENDAQIAVFLVYTWMAPARLETTHLANFEAAKEAIVKARTRRLERSDLDDVKLFVGGSLIATSKFLHLVNPALHGIWDRRVAWAGYRLQYPYQYNQTAKYIEYLSDLDALTLPPATRDRVGQKLGAATELRQKEFALFHLGVFEQTDETEVG